MQRIVLLLKICSFMLEVSVTISHHLKTAYIYLYGTNVGADDMQNYKSVYLYSLEANILTMSRHLGGSGGQKLRKPDFWIQNQTLPWCMPGFV